MKRLPVGSCGLCASWGTVTIAGLCQPCWFHRNRARRGMDNRREAVCRRCGWAAVVAADGTCRPCLDALRAGQDEAWTWTEVRRLPPLPAGRPRQLVFSLRGLRVPDAAPLRRGPEPKVGRGIPPWLRKAFPEAVRNEPDLFPAQVAGQLGLFPAPERCLTLADAARIHDREIPDLPLLAAQLMQMGKERGITGRSWLLVTTNMGRLALSCREPGEREVRSEMLPDLPEMHPTIGEALRRAGLLAPPRPGLARLRTPRADRERARRGDGTCTHCLAWAGTDNYWTVCEPCVGWRKEHPDCGPCRRCGRELPLSQGICRFCSLVLAETEVDVDGAALVAGDQLWFAGPWAPHLRTVGARCPGPQRDGRFASKRRLARAAQQAARPQSTHLVDPAQPGLFEAPARCWDQLDEARLPAPTPRAEAMLADFAAYILERGWKIERHATSTRTLRILACHLGVDAPIPEQDVRAIARLSPHHKGVRVADYLRRRGLLAEQDLGHPDLVRARRTAAALPQPFATGVSAWIDVLTGQSSRPSRAKSPETVHHYVRDTVPVLRAWAARGITDLREVTKDDIEKVLRPLHGAQARGIHVGLRSLFRALRRERMIFHDPARTIVLVNSPHLPVPVSTDLLKGALDKVLDSRGRLMLALVAIHALTRSQISRLLLADLDRAQGQLRVRRTGRLDHTVYLDEVTMKLATAWLVERNRRWPNTTNPHLIVTRRTAVDDAHPRASKEVTTSPFRTIGVPAGKLRQDRILDEARSTADPLGLMRIFGLANHSAVRYVAAARPAEIRPDPIAP